MAKSVGSIAEDIILQEISELQGGKVSRSSSLPVDTSSDQPDISNVEVPAGFVNKVLEESVDEDELLIEPKKLTNDGLVVDPTLDPSYNLFGNDRGNAEVANELLQRFQTLLQEAKGVIEEMTTVGMLGVNLSGPRKNKRAKKRNQQKKRTNITLEQMIKERAAKAVNPWAVCHKSTGPKKSASFERCVKHVKSKHPTKT